MYRIKEDVEKIRVVCSYCHSRPYHEVKSDCTRCGGNGVHNKSKKRWVVANRKEAIVKIDRDEKGGLRFWEDKSCYYPESNKIVHFTKADAVAECKKRNAELDAIEQEMRQEREKAEASTSLAHDEGCGCPKCGLGVFQVEPT